jgi:hypothetical protein
MIYGLSIKICGVSFYILLSLINVKGRTPFYLSSSGAALEG